MKSILLRLKSISAYLCREHRTETIVVMSYLVALIFYWIATSWGDLTHMLYRQYAVHLPSSPFALLLVYFPLRWASVKFKVWGRPLSFLGHPFFVILAAAFIIFLREAYDASQGVWLKSYYDLPHWIFFLSLSYWAMERWRRWQ